MPNEPLTLRLTVRQAQALRALAALEELPPEVYAAEGEPVRRTRP